MRHHRHDMTLAVKVTLNPNTTNQPTNLTTIIGGMFNKTFLYTI